MKTNETTMTAREALDHIAGLIPSSFSSGLDFERNPGFILGQIANYLRYAEAPLPDAKLGSKEEALYHIADEADPTSLVFGGAGVESNLEIKVREIARILRSYGFHIPSDDEKEVEA